MEEGGKRDSSPSCIRVGYMEETKERERKRDKNMKEKSGKERGRGRELEEKEEVGEVRMGQKR
jgi:hypothetical protein